MKNGVVTECVRLLACLLASLLACLFANFHACVSVVLACLQIHEKTGTVAYLLTFSLFLLDLLFTCLLACLLVYTVIIEQELVCEAFVRLLACLPFSLFYFLTLSFLTCLFACLLACLF